MENPYSRYMQPVVHFYVLQHIYTQTEDVPTEGAFRGQRPVHSIFIAKQENEYPPIVVIDNEERANTRILEYALLPIDEQKQLIDYVSRLSPKARKALEDALKENGWYLPKDGFQIHEELAKARICFKPIKRIRDIYQIEEINWSSFIERLIRWDAPEKDPRLNLAHKSQLLRGIEPRLNAHALVVTNAGTGKSIHYHTNGRLIDKATRNAFLGFAKSPTEVYKGTIDGEDYPVGIDQIEVGNWGIMDFMFNVMEYGEATVSSGAAKFTVKSRAPFAFMANPMTEKINVEKGFGAILDHLSNNPAIGRRFGVICYGTNYKVLTSKSTPESLDEWTQQSTFFRAIEEAARPELTKIMRSKGTWDWVNKEIPGYQERIEKVATGCLEDTIHMFFIEHAKAGQSRVRSAALQVSLVDFLKEIALGRYELDEVLEHAEEILPSFTQLNIESAVNIVKNISDEKRFFSEHWLESNATYLREIVYAVEYARRSQILGNVFNLTDIDYKPVAEGYTHLSQCIQKLTKRKRGIAQFNEECKKYFNFSFKPEGNQLKIYLESKTPIAWLKLPGYDDIEKKLEEVPESGLLPNVESLYKNAKEIIASNGGRLWAGEFWSKLEEKGHPRKYAEYVLKDPQSPVEFIGLHIKMKEAPA